MMRPRTRKRAAPRESIDVLDHGLWSAVAAQAFEMLDIGAAFVGTDARGWRPVHVVPETVSEWEMQFDRAAARRQYNRHNIFHVCRTRRTLVSQHSGFNDVFVPVVGSRGVSAVFVSGPFLRHPSDSAWIERTWRELSGHAAVLDDARFAAFLEMVLATPVLRGREFRAFVELCERFVALVSGVGDPRTSARRIDELLHRAWIATLDRRVDSTVSSMLDARRAATWWSGGKTFALRDVELEEPPGDVSVVLVFPMRGAPTNAVEQRLAQLEWQRACQRLTRSRHGVACGKLGDNGVVFLTPSRGRAHARRDQLLELAQAARDLAARRFELRAHAGIGPLGAPETLPARFRVCSAAAQQALCKDLAFVEPPNQPPPGGISALAQARSAVIHAFRSTPSRVEAVVDRYLDLVTEHTAFRDVAVRASLDTMLAELVGVLGASAAVDGRVVRALILELERQRDDAGNLPDLLARYRRVFVSLASAIERPTSADRDLKLRRGAAFLRQHFTESIRLADAARAAGLAPAYFSRLFKQTHGQSYEGFVHDLRLERAKELLRNTEMGVARVAQQAGFAAPKYFFQVFRKSLGVTPGEFRDSLRRRGRSASRGATTSARSDA